MIFIHFGVRFPDRVSKVDFSLLIHVVCTVCFEFRVIFRTIFTYRNVLNVSVLFFLPLLTPFFVLSLFT